MKRVLTLHLDGLRLTPEVVGVLGAVSEQFCKPEIKLRSDGLAIYVEDYSNRI